MNMQTSHNLLKNNYISSKFATPTKAEARAENWAIFVSKIASKLLLLGCMWLCQTQKCNLW